jgi:hypothetical protein
MKLFSYVKKNVEGMPLKPTALINYYVKYDSRVGRNGFQIVFLSPFKSVQTITNCNNFFEYTTECRKARSFLVRRWRGTGKWVCMRTFVWMPTRELTSADRDPGQSVGDV